MNQQHRLITGLGLVFAAGLVTVPATAQAMTSIQVAERTDQTQTRQERGIVLECRGKSHGLKAYVEVYENSAFGNHLQVVLGGPDAGRGAGGATEADLVRKGRLTRNVRVKVDGEVARIMGTAVRHGAKTPVHEEYDDAGQHITVDGTHRQVVTDLRMTYDGTKVDLNCDPAFAFNLTVVTEPAE